MWRSSPPVRLGIGVKALEKRSGKLHKNGRRHGRMQCFLFFGAGAPVLNYDKLSRSNEEANSLSKEDVIEIEGQFAASLFKSFHADSQTDRWR